MQQVTKEANYLTHTIHYINETEVRSCFTPENNKVVTRNRIRKVESTHLPNQTPLQDISSSKISSFIDNTERPTEFRF
jgi:hypothetical protein